MIQVTVSERFADPPICLYDPESRICFIPGKVVDLDEGRLTALQRAWLDQGALVTVEAEEGASRDVTRSGSEKQVLSLDEMSYVDLYRKAKRAGLRYAVTPKKARLIEDLSAAQKAAGVLTRPEGIHHG